MEKHLMEQVHGILVIFGVGNSQSYNTDNLKKYFSVLHEGFVC